MTAGGPRGTGIAHRAFAYGNRLLESSFALGVARLSGGTVIAASIGLAATPIVSRLYSPSEFGVLGIFASALAVASVVSTLRYDWAVPSAPDDRHAASILLVAFFAVVFTGVCCLGLVATGFVGFVVPATRGHTALLMWALPAGMVGVGLYTGLSSWMVRRSDYATLGQTKVAQSVSMVGAQIGLGVLKAGAVGLIVGQIAGSSGGILRLTKQVWKRDKAAFAGQTSRDLRNTAFNLRRFPLLSGPAALMDALTGALPLLVLASRFDATTAGQFTMVQRIIVAPLALMTTVIAQVIFGELAATHRSMTSAMFRTASRRLRQVFLLAVLVVGTMALSMPILIPTILGARWAEAGVFFLILSPMLVLNFVTSPFGSSLDVLRRQDLHFVRDSSRLIIMAAALVASSALHVGSRGTVAFVSAAGCLNALAYLGISMYAIVHRDRELAVVR